MIENQIFYWGITRKIIVAFGSLFSNVKVKRDVNQTDGPNSQTIEVPIAYAPKEKWLVRIEQDPNLSNHTYISLPRMSFEITGISYDPSRKTNRSALITCGDAGNMSRMFAPVPYNMDVTLYVLSKTQEDALQIIEQILPYFTPEFTMSVKAVPEFNVVVDVPIILNSVAVQDDYDGDFQTIRFVTYTLNFTLKAYMFGPASSAGTIEKVIVNSTNDEAGTNITAELEMLGDVNTGNITENWNES